MFRQVALDVIVNGSDVLFRFEQPVSLLLADVTKSTGEPVWNLVAEEFQAVENEGSFQTWPMDEAPPEILEMARLAEENAMKRLEEEGPLKPLITEIVYGVLPPGYRSEHGPEALVPGEYNVIVFTEQGHATATFSVAAV